MKLRQNGFTLAEMMVVLLILSITLAAFAPVMTQRHRAASGTSLWERTASGAGGIYYNLGNAESVIIGDTSKSSDDNAPLVLRKKAADHNYINFKDESGADAGVLFLGGDSVFLGTQPGDTGTYNSAFGYNALVGLSGGSNNTAFGYNACANVTGGAQLKTCIGANSGPTVETTTDTEEVWVGTSIATVHIPGDFAVGTAEIPKTIKLNGRDLRELIEEIIAQAAGGAGVSDRRLKNVQGANAGGLDKIRQLKVFDFTFKNDKTKTPRVGVMAQDLQKIFPNAVTKNSDGHLQIRQEDMFYALVNAVKELDEQNKRLRAKNTELEVRLLKLEAKIK